MMFDLTFNMLFDFYLISYPNPAPLDLLRGDVEDALRARRGLAAGLLQEEGHRGGLVPRLGGRNPSALEEWSHVEA